MAALVAQFFGMIGVDMLPPDNLAELIPYILTVVVGCVLVSAVFGVVGKLAEVLFSFRRL